MLGASTLPDLQNKTAVMKDVTQPTAPPAKTERQQDHLEANSVSSSPPQPPSPPDKVNGKSSIAQQTSSDGSAAVPRRERDSSWLELEACREHMRQACPRQADECRYAHPEQGIYVKDGRVTCCYDFLKDRCFRERCRYFHPPVHIKERLVSAGKQFGAMMSNLYIMPGSASTPQYPTSATNTFSHLNRAALPLMAPVIYSPDGRVLSAAPPGFFPCAPYGTGPERMDVCPYFSQGKCTNPTCPMIHPEPHVRINLDSTVTVCRDFLRGGCSREKCRYFHPPANVVAELDSSAVPAVVQQGIMVASPVVPVYPSVMYPVSGTVTSLPSAGVPIYPSAVHGVPLPIVVTPTAPPPTPVTLTKDYNSTPISTITSTLQGLSNQNEGRAVPSIVMAPPTSPFQN